MNNEELDSQLSAMFDDELPTPECELLARRLARDEALKARWGRYAVIGACIRVERGVRLNGDLAGRVSRMVAAEPSLLVGGGPARSARGLLDSGLPRWWRPVAGGAVVAAGVAATAILWLRAGSSPDVLMVDQPADVPAAPVVAPRSILAASLTTSSAASGSGSAASSAVSGPDSYVVPPAVRSPSFAPPMELASFVVAHSEYSMPLLRHSALSALVAEEVEASEADQASAAGASGRGAQSAAQDTPPTDATATDAPDRTGAAAHGRSHTGATSEMLNAPHADHAR